MYAVDAVRRRDSRSRPASRPSSSTSASSSLSQREGIARYIETCAQATTRVAGAAAARRAQGPRGGGGGAADAVQVPHEHASGRDRGVRRRPRGAGRARRAVAVHGAAALPAVVHGRVQACWMAFMDPGPVYVRGSFQALADALAGVVRARRDGRTTATARLGSASRTAGHGRDARGRPGSSRAEVGRLECRCTIDIRGLVGVEHVPDRLVQPSRRMRPSISAFLVYSACRRWSSTKSGSPPRSSSTTTGTTTRPGPTSRPDDGRDVAQRPDASRPLARSRRRAPRHLHVADALRHRRALVAREGSRHRADGRSIEALLPGYRDSITFLDSATPETFEQYTLAQSGAIYGWENTPNQTMPKRLPHVTPIEGLMLAGHWTTREPGACAACSPASTRRRPSPATAIRSASSARSRSPGETIAGRPFSSNVQGSR